MLSAAEYIWLDGHKPVRQIRSKMKIIDLPENPSLNDFSEWSFDGSSTEQALGKDSDCILKPVSFVKDPLREKGFLVIAEVYDADGKNAHASNSRSILRKVLEAGAKKQEPWIGFEQEYTIFKGVSPLGWPKEGYPAPQGPYYCGVGSKQIYGRELAERHAEVCLKAGLMFYGINAEVMPGQWEFQIGYRGVKGEDGDVLTVADHMLIARWLIHRVSEEFGVHISLDNKPVKGDWNGAGMHTNFSTKDTRDKQKGRQAISEAIGRLSSSHDEHIKHYGDKLEERLTGEHETADINQFSSGAADRGSSIRIPRPVQDKGYGYFEDRRPGANADPYIVAAKLCATVCDIDNEHAKFDWHDEEVA